MTARNKSRDNRWILIDFRAREREQRGGRQSALGEKKMDKEINTHTRKKKSAAMSCWRVINLMSRALGFMIIPVHINEEERKCKRRKKNCLEGHPELAENEHTHTLIITTRWMEDGNLWHWQD